MSDAEQAAQIAYHVGDSVPFHLVPGLVAASYCVSLVGAIMTTELLYRRVYRCGLLNFFQRLVCAGTMGLLTIWCMSLVGNTAIVLADGEPELQLRYSAAWIAFSCLVPIVALVIAFSIADLRYQGKLCKTVGSMVAGLFTGGAMISMHFLESHAIVGYRISYNPPIIVGSIAIAIVASIIAITLFFHLQERWLNTLVWRLACASTLAAAVSGMHFCADMGTVYTLLEESPYAVYWPWTNLIVALSITLTAMVYCGVALIKILYKRGEMETRAKQVALACARFDVHGNIMVTSEGLLPTRMITSKGNLLPPKSFNEEFTVNHPTFRWIFRVSHDWFSVAKHIRNMQKHLYTLNQLPQGGPRPMGIAPTAGDLARWSFKSRYTSYDTIFRESFCLAASGLARSMGQEIDGIGILFDQIVKTGLKLRKSNVLFSNFLTGCSPPTDIEAGPLNNDVTVEPSGKGQLLFLVSKVANPRLHSKLCNQGFRFVNPDTVLDRMAESLQVPPSYLAEVIRDLRNQANPTRPYLPSTVHIGVFALRPGIGTRPTQVLARRDAEAYLPSAQMTIQDLSCFEMEAFGRFEGKSVVECKSLLEVMMNDIDKRKKRFAKLFSDSIDKLALLVHEAWFASAVFSAKPLKLPVYDGRKGKGYRSVKANAWLMTFHIIPDIHNSILRRSPKVVWSPMALFKSRQRVLETAGRDHMFRDRVEQEVLEAWGQRMAYGGGGARITDSRGSVELEELATPNTGTITHTSMASLRDRIFGQRREIGAGSGRVSPVRPAGGVGTGSSSSLDKKQAAVDVTARDSPAVASSRDAPIGPYGGIQVSSEVMVFESPAGSSSLAELAAATSGVVPSRKPCSATRFCAQGGMADDPTFVDDILGTVMERRKGGLRYDSGL